MACEITFLIFGISTKKPEKTQNPVSIEAGIFIF